MFDKLFDKITSLLLEDSIAFITDSDRVPIVRFFVGFLLISFYLALIIILLVIGIQYCIKNNFIYGIVFIAFSLGIACLFGYFCYLLREEMRR